MYVLSSGRARDLTYDLDLYRLVCDTMDHLLVGKVRFIFDLLRFQCILTFDYVSHINIG